MDRGSIIGLLMGLITIGLGMMLKGVSPMAIINPAALIIIFLGTAASICIAFPMNTLKKLPMLLKIIFTKERDQEINDVITKIEEWADSTGKVGSLWLDGQLKELNDTF